MASADGSRAARGYPRPQLRRELWQSLDGTWAFAMDAGSAWSRPADVTWDRAIEVPFSPETERSGIGERALGACWYRRMIDTPTQGADERLILHFGAVDRCATVWLDGALVGRHEGGYTPFEFDVTGLSTREHSELVVRAEDDPADLAAPRGKQDWKPEPHGIWYPRTTGIWQTVWLEKVPATRVAELVLVPDLQRWEIQISVRITGPSIEGTRLRARLRAGQRLLADDTYAVLDGELSRGIALHDPGIGDARAELLWSPSSPTLIDVDLELVADDDRVLDRVSSYTAMRSIAADGGRILLNGYPIRLRMVLDQGYWADCGLTAPDDAALRRDVELTRSMGFNGARKHQKVEDPRYLYWADVLGLLVWEEMPSAYRFTPEAMVRTAREWTDVIARDRNHPCIIAWVPLNESWGVPDLATSPAQRHHAAALYHLTRSLDPTRLVIGNDGWENLDGATDVIGVHDYEADPGRLAGRYAGSRDALLRLERPGGRRLVLGDRGDCTAPIVLSEFGGVALSADPTGTWGYSRCKTAEELMARYRALMQAVRGCDMLAGTCYTQLTDTYQEVNGLLRMDRTAKVDIERIRRATTGASDPLV